MPVVDDAHGGQVERIFLIRLLGGALVGAHPDVRLAARVAVEPDLVGVIRRNVVISKQPTFSQPVPMYVL